MTVSTLRVGIIGVGSETSWGREAHVPSVHAVEGLALAAVATRDQRSADNAAASLGAERGYGDARDLFADPDVDIVSIATPVPSHRDLIVAAVRAGKHVITEWPAGIDTAQTEEIAGIAAGAGVRTAVDLQARLNPAAVRAGQLLDAGELGRILSATVFSSTAAFGSTVPEVARSLEDPAVGMNLTTIQTAHTVDFVLRLTGPLSSLAALTTIQFPDVTIGGDPAAQRRRVPDHVLVQGRLAGGGALSAQIVGGRAPGDTPFRADIVGEKRTLTVTGGADRGFQAGLLDLALDGAAVVLDDPPAGLSDSVVNVSRVYAALRDDVLGGSRTAPDFSDAVRLSHLIDDLLVAAGRQRTVTPTAPWPG